MKRMIALLLALIMMCGIAGAFAEDTVKIGIIVPFTGTMSLYGECMFKGATMAVDEINANGGLLGKQVELIKYDNQNDETESRNGFNWLIKQDVELIIGPLSSGTTKAIVDMANDEEVVLLTCTATNDALDEEDNFVFRCCYKDSFQGTIGAAFCYLNGYKKVGAIYCAADTYSKGLYDSFAAGCEKYGIEIVETASTASFDSMDVTNQFTAMIEKGAELVYTPYYYNTIGPLVVPQARSAGYTGVILGADGFDGVPDYVVPGADLDIYNNVYWNNHFDPNADSEIVRSFVSRYQALYNNETPNALSVLPYDAVYMFATAINNAGAADAESVREAMSDTSAVYELVTGTFTLNEDGSPNKGATMFEFYHDTENDRVDFRAISVINELPEVK
ncbi:MAG: ABC transporter substrate-binding protein [Clostridia bacterium]|nr:ABC transporter substrate-binding protein [Clostridia bacterium]